MSWSPIGPFNNTVSYVTFLFYMMQVEVDCAYMKFGGDRIEMYR